MCNILNMWVEFSLIFLFWGYDLFCIVMFFYGMVYMFSGKTKKKLNMIKKNSLSELSEYSLQLSTHVKSKFLFIFFICTYLHVQSEHNYNFLGEDSQVQPHSVSIAM